MVVDAPDHVGADRRHRLGCRDRRPAPASARSARRRPSCRRERFRRAQRGHEGARLAQQSEIPRILVGADQVEGGAGPFDTARCPTLGKPTRCDTASTGRNAARVFMALSSPGRSAWRRGLRPSANRRAVFSAAGDSGRMIAAHAEMPVAIACSTSMPRGALKASLNPTPSPLISRSELRNAACTSSKRPIAKTSGRYRTTGPASRQAVVGDRDRRDWSRRRDRCR